MSGTVRRPGLHLPDFYERTVLGDGSVRLRWDEFGISVTGATDAEAQEAFNLAFLDFASSSPENADRVIAFITANGSAIDTPR